MELSSPRFTVSVTSLVVLPCFSLTVPGGKVPGNSFMTIHLWEMRGLLLAAIASHNRSRGRPAVDCSLQCIWSEYSRPRAGSAVVAALDEKLGGKYLKALQCCRRLISPICWPWAPQPTALWKVSFIRWTDFHLDSSPPAEILLGMPLNYYQTLGFVCVSRRVCMWESGYFTKCVFLSNSLTSPKQFHTVCFTRPFLYIL